MEKLLSIVDEIYPAICKDNDEKPSAKALDALKDRIQTESKQFSDDGNLVLRQFRIGLHASIALAKSAPHGHIRVLDLSENAIDDCSIVALLQIVDKNNNLSELRLSSNQITVDGAAELAKTLPSMRQLLLLDLSNDVGSRNKNVINDEGLTVLCNAISKNFSLLSLNLVGNNINELDAASIGQVLRLNLTLTHLDLDRNKLGTRGAQILFEALARNKALRHLSLAQNGIGADAARAINTMLVNNNSLVALHLQNNSIGLALPDLAEAMLQNRSIVVLDLQGNGIVDAGATAFAHVLASNIYLTNINLSNNNIGQAGGIMISKALAKNKVLTSLDISSNDIKDESAISIAEAMVRNTSLVSLDLSSCKITDDGAVAIATAIGSNDGIVLRSLRLRDNYISNSAGQILLDELQANTSITAADFRGNRMDHTTLGKIRAFCKRNVSHIRNQVPKRLKEQIDSLKKDITILTDTLEGLTERKGEVHNALEELETVNEEKMHCHLAQQAMRDELTKRLVREEQQLNEIKAKITQKETEFTTNCSNFKKQLDTKNRQLDIEKKQRMEMEEQIATVTAQLENLNIPVEQTMEEIQLNIDRTRREKLKYQNMMTTVRSKCNSIQKGHESGEGIPEYLERARYLLLHPEC